MKLPACAEEYIKLIVKKIRYRRKVRQEVREELTAHFEDELKDCETDEDRQQKAKELITGFGDVKLLAVLLRRAKKRCRPLWRTAVVRSFQALGIIILYLFICMIPLFVGRPTISVNYVDWLNELVQRGRDEAGNARPYYEKAVKLYVKNPEEAKYFISNYRWHKEEYPYEDEFFSIRIRGTRIIVVYRLEEKNDQNLRADT